MYQRLYEDLQHFDQLIEATKNVAGEFLQSLPHRPVAKIVTEPQVHTLPKQGLGGLDTLQLFKDSYFHLLSGSAGPRYLGFVIGGATPASVAGDWLTAAIDQNLSNYGESVAPEIELQTIDLLLDLFGLPSTFTGTFVTGATMANFVGLAQGRYWAASKAGINISLEGLYQLPPIRVVSGCAHSSIYKSLSMLGMGKNHLHLIPTLPDRECIDLQKLEEFLAGLQGEQCIVVGNAGTVNTVDFDDLKGIARLKEKYDFWFHVDAAFGGFAACTRQHSHLLKGLDQADSITIDAHKWLNVPYDSAMQFSQHPKIQLEVFQNSAAYLGEIGDKPDFVHLTPENSRRFRALPVWFSLMAYGKAGYQEIVERDIALAKLLSDKIEKSNAFELLAPTRLNVVCFTLRQQSINLEKIQNYLHQLSLEGKVFMTQTIYEGQPGIRAAFSNWRTTTEDVAVIWDSMVSVKKKLED